VCRLRLYMLLLVIATLLTVVGPVLGAESQITYQVTQKEDYKEIEVTTALTSYVFSEDGGSLKSVFLHFASYGSTVTELAPGTKTDRETLERQYVANTRFPFVFDIEGLESSFVLSEPRQPSSEELVVEFRGTLGDLAVTKRFVIHNDPYYTIDVEIAIDNPSEQERSLPLSLGDYIPKEKGPSLVYLFDGAPTSDLLAAGPSFDGLGLMDKTTVFFLKTNSAPGVSPFVERTAAGNRHFGVTLSASAGGMTSYAFSLYGGRRRFLLMDAVGLGKLDAPGNGAKMMIPVIQFLQMLYRATGNYGWAIILLTLLLRVVLFPLMRKQYHSMAKMQKLTPKMQQLRQRFKDDRQLQQQKLMELYKKEGVNPMGGCLPMIIQLPILVLLWKAILYSAEQIHLSPGFLWLSDLSLRDPYFILVILTTAVMILQSKLMTPMTAGEGSGSQKYMGYIFPIFMAVFLYNFPAGLWLYYFLTTILQVGQQYFVNWEMARAEEGSPTVSADTDALEEDQQDNGDRQEGD